MSFLDTGSRNDIFSRCRLVERCLSQITYHGKTSYQDMMSRKVILPRYDNQGKTSYQDLISQKDCLPRHDITTRRLAKIMISRKDIFPRYILARRLSEISYLGKTSFRDIYLDKTSFCDIRSWQEVLS